MLTKLPPVQDIVIVGASRAGRTLQAALTDRGRAVVLHHARKTLEEEDLPASIAGAHLLVVAVPDRFLESTSAAIAGRLGWARGTVLHLSGSLDHTLLRPFYCKGRSVASCHPMQTLTGEGSAADVFDGVTFGVEGQPRARREAVNLARTLGGVPVPIRRGSKMLYHLAASLAGNATVGLFGLAVELLEETGFTPLAARNALAPLVQTALKNAADLGAGDALTGPVARGDEATLSRHREALATVDASLLPLYDLLVIAQRRALSRDSKVGRRPRRRKIAAVSTVRC
jgi:predicted short-subunit dehydrogenase-like oxidoreductase (DUF2520 family)